MSLKVSATYFPHHSVISKAPSNSVKKHLPMQENHCYSQSENPQIFKDLSRVFNVT